MPVLLVWRAPHDVARPERADGTAFALHIAAACGANQCLAEWMRMPVAARAGLEGDVGAGRARGRGRLEELVYTHRAGEVFGGPSGRGLRTVWLEFHERP